MTTWAEEKDLDVLLLERYCSGAASPEETAQIEGWLSAHPEQRCWYEQFRAELRKQNFSPMSEEERTIAWLAFIRIAIQRCPETRVDVQGVLQARDNVVVSAHQSESEIMSPKSAAFPDALRMTRRKSGLLLGQPLRRGGWYALVGALAGALMVVLGWQASASRFGSHRNLTMSTYTTGNGERGNITLPDGNRVTLNVASHLDVPADYAAGNHTVSLVGEALFTVLHHDRSPFAVRTGSTTAQVLGTSFVVRHYPTDTATAVAVQDGKVAVRSLIVTAGRQLQISRTGVTQTLPADPALFSFAAGVLTLNGAPLNDAIPELDRWYGVDIKLSSPALASQQLAGEYVAGSVADLIEILQGSLPLRVVRDGRVLTLYPR